MIPFEKAVEIIINSAIELGTEEVILNNSLNRVLAQDVVSDVDMPSHNKALMDGYVCRRQDLHNILEVIETIPAGKMPKKKIELNKCSMIMTGSVIPDGADCVVKVEDVENVSKKKIKVVGNDHENYICTKGQHIKKGEIVIKKGSLISPKHISILASVGIAKPLVYKQPKVGIIATGNEIVEPTKSPSVAQKRNSNSYQLYAQLKTVGAIPTYYGIVKDNKKAIDKAVKKALVKNDVILVSGGVSMGLFDFVPEILKENSFNLLFEKVALKPGKPTIFGTSAENKFCFGLPGNPVSTFVTFELFVKPFLYKMMGLNFKPLKTKAALNKAVSRKQTERREWLPVKFSDEGTVTPVIYYGSSHSTALCLADGLISIPQGVDEIEEDSLVTVRII